MWKENFLRLVKQHESMKLAFIEKAVVTYRRDSISVVSTLVHMINAISISSQIKVDFSLSPFP